MKMLKASAHQQIQFQIEQFEHCYGREMIQEAILICPVEPLEQFMKSGLTRWMDGLPIEILRLHMNNLVETFGLEKVIMAFKFNGYEVIKERFVKAA